MSKKNISDSLHRSRDQQHQHKQQQHRGINQIIGFAAISPALAIIVCIFCILARARASIYWQSIFVKYYQRATSTRAW